ncbi:peptidoglycan recognition protein family protein [Streptomyces cyaneofuscatus]|uniref:peptidoglycan recognition protein family protein n=1 Tax=Streptomyces cyaneofuscatus TaxID=66883 RepID=UPI003434EA3C
MELQPESDKQEAIRPTQFIVHSIVAPWTARRTYEYWRDSTNLESHFGVDYEGTVGQYIGTETRADANAGANRRSDGTGAVSAETASNTKATDPWNAKQIEDLIAIGVWLHQRHGIPLRICRSHSDPGFGYHSMFPQWSTSGTACPGKARIAQFKTVVFPGIVARATNKPSPTPPKETPMPLTDADLKLLATKDGFFPAPRDAADYSPDKKKAGHYWSLGTHLQAQSEGVRATRRELAALSAAVTALAGQVGKGADTATVVAAVQKAIADAVIKVDVDINSKES